MAHPFFHARSSARSFGGVWEDYIDLHTWMDYSKSAIADCRHRLFTHNAWGIWLGQKIWGQALIRKSDEKAVPVRPLLEAHITEDFRFIPTLERCFKQLPKDEGPPLKWLHEQRQHTHEILQLHYVNAVTENLTFDERMAMVDRIIAIHQFLDWPWQYLPDHRHRRLLHNTWGVELAIQIFEETQFNLNTRVIATEHIIFELGYLPTLEQCLEGIVLEREWMCRGARQLSKEYEEETDAPTLTGRGSSNG